jgi:hypothetical protein
MLVNEFRRCALLHKLDGAIRKSEGGHSYTVRRMGCHHAHLTTHLRLFHVLELDVRPWRACKVIFRAPGQYHGTRPSAFTRERALHFRCARPVHFVAAIRVFHRHADVTRRAPPRAPAANAECGGLEDVRNPIGSRPLRDRYREVGAEGE